MKSARNRNHATSACVSCRKRKTKCDEVHPVCSSCTKKGRECEWTPDSDRRTARGRKCEDCAAWRVKCAELEARLAVFEGRPERHLGQSSAHMAHEQFPQPLHTAKDVDARQITLWPNAWEQRCFQDPLFPLHEEPIAGAHAENSERRGNIGTADWLSAGFSAPFPGAAPYTELDALYGCPFATAAPSGVLDLALDSCVGSDSATEHAQP